MLLVVALAGCMDLPQPFRHDAGSASLARPVFDDTADQVQDQAAAPRKLTVRLGAFSGLPGDGDQMLRRAVKGALERRGLLVVGNGGDVLIEPHLQFLPNAPDGAQLDVTWDMSLENGAKLGQVSQHGIITAAALAGDWGRQAHDIAEGSADGILQIVQETFTNGVRG